jgi:hypothetical protein
MASNEEKRKAMLEKLAQLDKANEAGPVTAKPLPKDAIAKTSTKGASIPGIVWDIYRATGEKTGVHVEKFESSRAETTGFETKKHRFTVIVLLDDVTIHDTESISLSSERVLEFVAKYKPGKEEKNVPKDLLDMRRTARIRHFQLVTVTPQSATDINLGALVRLEGALFNLGKSKKGGIQSYFNVMAVNQVRPPKVPLQHADYHGNMAIALESFFAENDYPIPNLVANPPEDPYEQFLLPLSISDAVTLFDHTGTAHANVSFELFEKSAEKAIDEFTDKNGVKARRVILSTEGRNIHAGSSTVSRYQIRTTGIYEVAEFLGPKNKEAMRNLSFLYRELTTYVLATFDQEASKSQPINTESTGPHEFGLAMLARQFYTNLADVVKQVGIPISASIATGLLDGSIDGAKQYSTGLDEELNRRNSAVFYANDMSTSALNALSKKYSFFIVLPPPQRTVMLQTLPAGAVNDDMQAELVAALANANPQFVHIYAVRESPPFTFTNSKRKEPAGDSTPEKRAKIDDQAAVDEAMRGISSDDIPTDEE